MSAHPASTFQAVRDARDAAADLSWSSRVARKVVCAAGGAPTDIEQDFGLNDHERVIWRVMQIPRRYLDVENSGVLPPEVTRSIVRGLAEAGVIEVRDEGTPRPILPVELVRLKNAVRGVEAPKASTQRLQARVYRPDIGVPAATTPASPAPATPTAAPASRPSAAAPTPVARAAPAPAAAPRPAPVAASPAPASRPVGVDLGPEPTPASAPDLDPETLALKRRIETVHAALREQNHYQFLSIPQSAGPADIKKAFFALAREFHPDVLAGTPLAQDPALSKKIAALFQRLQDAQRILSDAQERQAYDARLKHDPTGGAQGGDGARSARPEEARLLATKASHQLKAREFALADRHYRQAVDLDPANPEIRLGLAWCIYLNETQPKAERLAEAQKRLEELSRSGNAEAAWKLASIARAEGLTDEFATRVAQTLKLNPRHTDALREQRLEEMRRQRQEEEAQRPAGLLDRLKLR